MSRAEIWALIILGLIFLLFGGGERFLGLIFIGAGLYLGLKPGGILRKEQVLDSWSVLIETAQGKAGDVFQDTINFIEESKAPALRTSREEMSPGVVKSILGDKRDFLVVREAQLSPYQIFINVRDYGVNLDVSWYLTYRPSILEAFLSLFRSSAFAFSELDLFEQQDLIAYATVCHYSTLKAVEKLMQKLNQDPTKINRKSKGFLGIS